MQPTGERLIGREREIELIESFVARTAAEGGTLLVTGEAGVGKSFAGLHQLAYPFIERLDRVSSPHRRALHAAMGSVEGTVPDQLTMSNATLALLREVARDRTVFVIVDDLHWIDQASAVVFGFVARRLSGSAVALLGGGKLFSSTSQSSWGRVGGRNPARSGSKPTGVNPCWRRYTGGMQVEVHLHAELARLAPGTRGVLSLEVPEGAHVSDLLKRLALDSQRRIIVGLNGEAAGLDQELVDGARIDLLTPMAGGSARARSS